MLDARALFEAFHELAHFVMASAPHQPARGFGEPAVQEINRDDGEPAHDERHAPRDVQRKIVDGPRAAERRKQIGGRQDGVADADEDAAVLGRGDFGKHQVGEREDGPGPEPADEAHGDDPREVFVEAADQCKEREDEDAPEQDALAPETVGQEARRSRTYDDPRRGTGTEQAERAGVEVPYFLEDGHNLADHAEIEGFHDPAPRKQPDKCQEGLVERHTFHPGNQVRFLLQVRRLHTVSFPKACAD